MPKRFEDEIEDILERSPDLPDGLNLSGLSLSEKITPIPNSCPPLITIPLVWGDSGDRKSVV